MSIFGSILEKLGIKKPAPQPAPAPTPATPLSHLTPPTAANPIPFIPSTPVAPSAPVTLPASVAPSAPVAPPPHFTPPLPGIPFAPEGPSAPQATPVPSAAPVQIPVVDVISKLEKMAVSRSSEQLDWKVSIVDLLKLLGIDSSYEARKALAIELGCPTEKMGDSALMNMWLHKTVLQKIADNGGNIPKELLD